MSYVYMLSEKDKWIVYDQTHGELAAECVCARARASALVWSVALLQNILHLLCKMESNKTISMHAIQVHRANILWPFV